MVSYLSRQDVIYIVMKRENIENFEGGYINGIKRLPDKAFEALEDACNYIMEQEPVVLDCWKLVSDKFYHRYDAACERHLTYEATHNDHTFYKDIYYDIIPESLVKKE